MADGSLPLPGGKSNFPWRGICAGLLAALLFFAAYYGGGQEFWLAAFWGAAALVGASLFLGLDPDPPKLWELPPGMTAEQFRAALMDAKGQIDAIRQANEAIPAPEATARLERICDHADRIVDLFIRDPKDMARGYKFLDVYLAGVTRIADQYADTHQRVESEGLDARFLDLLGQLEESFREQHDHLLKDDLLSLDVDMEVLQKRLEREGL